MAAAKQEQLRIIRHEIWSRTVSKIVGDLIKWGGICYCVYRASIVSIEWAGQRTIADLDVKLTASLGKPGWLVVALCIIIAVAGIWYGRNCNRLQRQTVRHFEAQKQIREKEIDPGRTSSQLTRSGETPIE